MDFRHNLQKYHEYIESLEHERQKILVFRRELPLCLELVTQALEACKRQLGTAECLTAGGQSDQSSEQTATTSSNRGPVLAEFIPVKRACSSSSSSSHNNDNDDDDDDVAGEEDLPSHPLQHRRPKISSLHDSDESCIMKSDWLRSVQLWNQTSPSPPTTTREQENRPTRKVSVVEVKSNGGAFKPFQKAKTCPNNAVTKPAPEATSASSAAKKGEKEGLSSQRKTRRCWSPELHKRFLNALQELGGSHVATPKQIREMMKVDGLTNDEVKSHLQKYRLHTRRPAASNSSAQAPQIVVVGGIWVPPPQEYTAASMGDASAATAPPRIYAPVAASASSHGVRERDR